MSLLQLLLYHACAAQGLIGTLLQCICFPPYVKHASTLQDTEVRLVAAGKTKETAQRVAGTVEEKAVEAKEKLAEAAQKGKEKIVSGPTLLAAKTGIRAPTTPEHKVHPSIHYIRHAYSTTKKLSTDFAEAPQSCMVLA
jgi:hypothetical protein